MRLNLNRPRPDPRPRRRTYDHSYVEKHRDRVWRDATRYRTHV